MAVWDSKPRVFVVGEPDSLVLHTQSPCISRGFLFLQRLQYSLKTASDTWHHCLAESCLDVLFSWCQSAIVLRIHDKSNVNFICQKTTYIAQLITTV